MEKVAEKIFAPALQYIQNNLDKSITLHDIAASVNMSHSHFSHQFKKFYGFSPYEYLIIERINLAKYLLKTTDMPVKEIAWKIGYQNASTFSTVFISKAGISPTAFRSFPI